MKNFSTLLFARVNNFFFARQCFILVHHRLSEDHILAVIKKNTHNMRRRNFPVVEAILDKKKKKMRLREKVCGIRQVDCDRTTGRDSVIPAAGATERIGRTVKAPQGRGERDPRRPRAIGLLVRRERQESSRRRTE